jgi:DNA-binding transcriptional LysR family regulator
LSRSPRYVAFEAPPASPRHLGEETLEVEVGGRFQVNSVGMFRRLATLDLGVALLPVEMAAEDLAAGRLRRILPEWQTSSAPVYALTETRLLAAKTLRFIEFLRERLARRIRALGAGPLGSSTECRKVSFR